MWFLVDINLNFEEEGETLDMVITTNDTIDYDSKLWINSEDTGLLEMFFYPNQSHLGRTIDISLKINTSIFVRRIY